MKFKSVALAAALLAATAAQAAVTLDLTPGYVDFASSLAAQTYEFTLATDVIGDGTVTATFGAKSGYDITKVTFQGGTLAPVVVFPGFDNFVLFSGPLSAGTYSFTVEGIAKSVAGQYTGRIDVTPVPEPESLALMLAGLGVAGVLARRRSAK